MSLVLSQNCAQRQVPLAILSRVLKSLLLGSNNFHSGSGLTKCNSNGLFVKFVGDLIARMEYDMILLMDEICVSYRSALDQVIGNKQS